MANILFRLLVLAALPLLLLPAGGCMSEITVSRVSPRERVNYGINTTGEGITQDTSNLLANFLLTDLYEDDPPALISRLQQLFKNEPRPEYLCALADSALNLGLRYASKPDLAIQYYLAAALYSYGYLVALDDPGSRPYSEERVTMIRIYNVAITEIFAYLHKRDLYRNNSFELTSIGGQKVTFTAPLYRLPLPESSYSDFLLCADYRPENLTHVSRRFGIGAPLICQIKPHSEADAARFADQQALPATLAIRFDQNNNRWDDVTARLEFLDSRNIDSTRVGRNEIPLELDFSTPLAYMVRNPPPFGYLEYMLNPDKTRRMQGLYMMEPYSDDRIPVVFVHGLMSNTRTWMQMINTLQNDPVLRKYYQFWGFSYSSGNPVLYSAQMLRDDLNTEAERLKATGLSDKMFNRMVVVGHSMGGLLSQTLIMNADNRLIEPLLGSSYKGTLDNLSPDQRDFVSRMLDFSALPFVKRVIFIAVPHRGSTLARSTLGQFGASLIHLPSSLVKDGEGLIGNLMQHGYLMPNDSRHHTGIDNLDPDDKTMSLLNKIPFVSGIPYHSIIGNRKFAGAPGGSDGIVPYSSSHLDGAASELVVKSDHSVQQNPLAIQEMRRILLEHLKQYPDLKIDSPELPKNLNPEP